MFNYSISELFPKASESEIQETKQWLEKVQEMKIEIKELESRDEETLTVKERQLLATYKHLTSSLERAANLIRDIEIKRIILFRYFKDNRNKETVRYFEGMMHERTVNYKLEKGIEAIANSIKLRSV